MAEKIIHEVSANHLLAAVLQSDNILGQVQREIYRLLPGISIEQLRKMLHDEIMRSEVVEGPQAQEAHLLLERMNQLRAGGLTMTQTLKRVTSPTKDGDEDDDDAYRILLDDKRNSGHGG